MDGRGRLPAREWNCPARMSRGISDTSMIHSVPSNLPPNDRLRGIRIELFREVAVLHPARNHNTYRLDIFDRRQPRVVSRSLAACSRGTVADRHQT